MINLTGNRKYGARKNIFIESNSVRKFSRRLLIAEATFTLARICLLFAVPSIFNGFRHFKPTT